MKKEFLDIYEKSVDGIFRYFYEKSGDRDEALKRTEHVFAQTWDSLANNKNVSLIADDECEDKRAETEYGYRETGVDRGFKARQYKFQG